MHSTATPPLELHPRFSRALTVGYAAIAVTVLVWAGFALTTRAMGASALSFADVALIRSGVPALLFLPFLPARLPLLRALPLRNWIMITAGAGLPFFWLAAQGAALTSATHVGALIAGTIPLSVALITATASRKLPPLSVLAALGVIAAGVAVLIAGSGAAGSLPGAGLLLMASLLWAFYTLGLRGSGLDPVGCALVVALPSALLLLALIGAGALPSSLAQSDLNSILPYLLVQGLGVGVIANLTYALAISRLGPAKSAAIGALAPALAAVLAVPLLHEPLPLISMLAVALICTGVMLANRQKG
ncbi:MAG: EamA family transporter [Sulfitobacter sp.]